MKKLIYGSTALKHWFPDFKSEPKDLDFISREKPEKQKGIEYHWCDSFQYVLDNNKDPDFVEPDFLYTIKVSHAAWNVFWEKTMRHIIFLKNKGCKLDHRLYSMLIKEWEVIHGRKKVNLNKQNYDFFSDSVKRKYDHDWLHEQFAFNERPMHERIRKDIDSPLCSKELWDQLSFEDQLKCALEETRVIAFERYVLAGSSPRIARSKALKNLITSMTKGWFNLFLIENFERLVYYRDSEFEQKAKELVS